MDRKSDTSKLPEVAKPPTASREITLKRALNLVQTTFLGVGTAIGGIMFAIMGRAVQTAGPSLAITFLIGSVFALLVGICYAELGAAVPAGAGGAVSFVRRAFGERVPTFIAGWFDWIGSIADCAVGSLVFAFAVYYFLPWVEPFTLAVVILIFFALINFLGARSTGISQLILTAVLIISLSLYMIGSTATFEIRRFEPLFPNGYAPTLLMVSYIFPTYAGYETITQLSEEVKTAGKTIPRALFITLIIITILFTGSAIATIGGAPQEVYVGSDTPLQQAANYFMGPIGGAIVSVGSIIATLSTINGSMAGGTRISFALSRSNFLPHHLSKVHPKYRSPYTSLLTTTLVAVALVLTRSVDFIVYGISLGYTVTAIMVVLALIRLRKTEPHLFRPFKVPLYPYLPAITIGALIFLLLTISVESLIMGAVLGVVGIGLLMIRRTSRKNVAMDKHPA